MNAELPAHVREILEGDYGLEECFEIMRAARVKAEYLFRAEAEHSNAEIATAVSAMIAPLNELSNEIELGLRGLEKKLSGQ